MADPFTLAIDLDYSNGPTPSAATDLEGYARELDDTDRELREKRARFVVVWRSIQLSQRGSVNLSKDRYSERKLEMAELQRSISRLENHLSYHNHYESQQWPVWQESPANVSLTQVWALWRNVVAARRAEDALPKAPAYTHDMMNDFWFAEYCALCLADTVTVRQRKDARLAREIAEWTYDCALRVFEGRARWDWDKHVHNGRRMRAPKRPEPRLRVKPQRAKFVRGADGAKIPLRSM
jgi:hypothetical protein